MPRLEAVEVWTDTVFNGGTLLQQELPQFLVKFETERHLEGGSGSLVVDGGTVFGQSLATGRVVRACYDQTRTVWREWRCGQQERSAGSLHLTQTLIPMRDDLARRQQLVTRTDEFGRVLTRFQARSMTPDGILTAFFTSAFPSYVAIGNTTFTMLIDVDFDGDTVLSGILKIVAAIQAKGSTCEFDLRADTGSGKYEIDFLTQLGSGAPVPEFRDFKNLVDVTEQTDAPAQGTRLIALGAVGDDGQRATIGQALWEVTASTATTFTVADLLSGASPIALTDLVDNLYWVKPDGTTTVQITGATTAGVLTVAAGHGVAVGDWGRFAASSTGTELIALDHPTYVQAPPTGSGVLLQKVEDATIDDTNNWMPNGLASKWTGAATVPPDGWTSVGTVTIGRITSGPELRFGRYAIRLQPQTGVAAEGIRLSKAIRVRPGYTRCSVKIGLYVNEVQAPGVSVELKINGAAVAGSPTYYTNEDEYIEHTLWTDLDVSAHVNTSPTFEVSILGQRGVALPFSDFAVDYVQLTFTSAQRAPTDGSSPAKLWFLLTQTLQQVGPPPKKYRAQVRDLQAADPLGYPYDAYTLGGSVRLVDSTLDTLVTPRIVRIRTDELQPDLDTTLEFAERFEQFTRRLARG